MNKQKSEKFMIDVKKEDFSNLCNIVYQFIGYSKINSIQQNISGHINSTYIVKTVDEKKYVLQKINTFIFKNPDELMHNIFGITEYIRSKITANGEDATRRTLNFLKTLDGKMYYKSECGECWRLYTYIDNVTSYMAIDNQEVFYNCAKSFGEFQQILSDYPANELYETIPNFHNTVSRFEDFKKAVRENKAGRLCEVAKEVDFVISKEKYYSYITDRIADKTLSLRVTHNDTKINNILIDNDTLTGICVIDLDTVMPGSVLYDFGDSIRFGACSTAEDETDQSKVHIKLDLYEAYTKGFLEGTNNSLNREEIIALPYGALIMTLENGMRFLGDYLNGDVYFAAHRKGQNLDRARTQFALAEDIEKHLPEMIEIAKKYGNIK